MRKFLAALLMLIMLTPSLVCAMPVCADEAQAQATQQPCAGHSSHYEGKKEDKAAKVNLLKDCMGVDLQAADMLSLQKPDMEDMALSIAAAPVQHNGFYPASTAAIRGPPLDWPDITKSQPSVLLMTLRFRE